ncbi:hypothetical protein [Nocardioides hwasunensis]|uniref:DUF2550 family protein n=1 Tax=Nocardioides hwasunensis TaxID=397258 RepID=A0ABR8ME42_9ACTN|nr:hypothetical protein [Nocardioides hwasunensis]MBD3912997.1 hypothetical protein [Nocardioides hwasunensis]
MSSFYWIAFLLPIAAGLVIALVVVVLVVAAVRKPVQPGWLPAPTGGVGVWNAEVLGDGVVGRMGGTMTSTFGLFHLEGATLSFTPSGTTVPAWRVECRQLVVAHRAMLSLDGADVRLTGPMGDLRCNVSVERLNRVTRNNFKDLRQRRYSRDFVALLVAHGAVTRSLP